MTQEDKLKAVPIWERFNLTVYEASLYSGISTAKIYELTEDPECKFVLWIGSKRLIKRKQFDEFMDHAYAI